MSPLYNSFVESVQQHFKNEVNIPTNKFPGAILYTSHNSLKPQKYLFMGLNPSGSPLTSMKIQESLDKCLNSSYNEYEEDWSGVDSPDKQTKNYKYKAGCHPIQLNIKHICALLDLKVEEICSENLVYEPSHGAKALWKKFVEQKLDARKEIERIYLPVHKLILDIVQPKVIITYGNDEYFSPYWFLRGIAKNEKDSIFPPESTTMPTGHKPFTFKYFKGVIFGKVTHVVGLPHLSYYSLYKGATTAPEAYVRKNEAFAKFMKEKIDITVQPYELIEPLCNPAT